MSHSRIKLADLERPCPVCQLPALLFTATGIDINDDDFGVTRHEMVCSHGHAELVRVIPFIGFGSSRNRELKPQWLQSQLEKTQA